MTKKTWTALTIVAVLATLGPISAFFAAGVARSWANGDRLLAGLYLVAIPSGLTLLTASIVWATKWAAG